MTSNELTQKAKTFIKGLKITASKCEVIRNQYGNAQKYYFAIKTNNGTYSAIFTDSIHNFNNKIKLNLDDILYSWVVDAGCFESSLNFDDFCLNFGYDFKNYDEYDSRYKEIKQNAIKAWHGCRIASEKLNELLTSEQIEQLQTLFQDY